MKSREPKQILIVGTGKLAAELLAALPGKTAARVLAWTAAKTPEPAIVVHAGSGRELEGVIAWCQETGATLIELSTGSVLEDHEPGFPLLLCPNTNILMLKFMAMLAAHGQQFRNYRISLTESHQAGKTSVPGTAVALAHSLGLPQENIHSIRDPQEQRDSLHIPPEYLARHAYHRIEIADQAVSVALETRVFGPAPYADGLQQIIAALRCHPLENRRHDIMELIDKGWL